MDIYNKIEREKRSNLRKILLPLVVAAAAGYFLYRLIEGGFFLGWEMYFAVFCYAAILLVILIGDLRVIKWMHYSIYIDDNIVKIKDGFFYRTILIPADRLYYISSVRTGGIGYDSILITDKKINHKKVRKLSAADFSEETERTSIINELNELYPDKTFYYYRVRHRGYKFYYYFYMLYRNCEICKFSDVSMELVKCTSGQK